MATAKQRKPSWKRAVLMLTGFVALPMIFLGVIPGASTAYDRSHRLIVECTVLSAEVSSGSSRSLRGAGSSSTLVVIETENCGELLQSEGVYRENAAIVADELQPGLYRFEVGQSGWALRGIYRFLRVSPSVSSYERLS